MRGEVPSVTDVPVEGTQGGSLEKSSEPGDNAVTVVGARGATAMDNDMRLQTSYQYFSQVSAETWWQNLSLKMFYKMQYILKIVATCRMPALPKLEAFGV